jgi:hypothetical protein
MAWNHYYIFVKGAKSLDLADVLSRLNLSDYKPAQETTLSYANKPTTLFAGFHNGNLLLVHQDLVIKFFGPEQSEEETLFVQTFPDAEIAVLIINESVGLFSYAIIKNGKKIRMKDGCDGNIYNDSGDPLPEELEILSEKIFMEEEIEEMGENGLSDQEIADTIKFEASYRVPNRLTKRNLGETVLKIDPDRVKLTKYIKV